MKEWNTPIIEELNITETSDIGTDIETNYNDAKNNWDAIQEAMKKYYSDRLS